MRNAEGYSVIVSPGERPVEHDTATCGHCQQITFTQSTMGKPQVLVFRADGSHVMRDIGFCRNCFRHICPRCEGKDCLPFEKRIDAEERVARRLVCL